SGGSDDEKSETEASADAAEDGGDEAVETAAADEPDDTPDPDEVAATGTETEVDGDEPQTPLIDDEALKFARMMGGGAGLRVVTQLVDLAHPMGSAIVDPAVADDDHPMVDDHLTTSVATDAVPATDDDRERREERRNRREERRKKREEARKDAETKDQKPDTSFLDVKED